MFGIVRPCRHRVSEAERAEWMSHLCGLCLTLRDEHGHAARLVTNYDGLLVSVLVAAQRPEASPTRRAAPCALRGMRAATVVDARAEGARLAAAVSLVLAAAKARDHAADGDLPRLIPPVLPGRLAARWEAAGRLAADAVSGLRAALAEADLAEPRLAHTLLVHEVRQAVRHAAHASLPGLEPPRRRRRALPLACAAWATMCCTCQFCCCEHENPMTGRRGQPWCQAGDCGPCDCCGGCDNCHGCGSCDCCDGCDCCDCSC